MLRFPLVAEVGDGALLAVGHEDRIEAEAFAAAGLVGDAAAERARAAPLAAVRRDRDELRHVARAASVSVDAVEHAEHPADLVAGRAPRRGHAGPAVEGRDLDPGVLPDHPRVSRRALTRE